MPAPKKRKDYNFHYTDNTYMTFSLNADDYRQVQDDFIRSKLATSTSVGLISLVNLRFVVELKPEPKVKPNKGAEPVLDKDELDWYDQYMKGELELEADTEGRYQ